MKEKQGTMYDVIKYLYNKQYKLAIETNWYNYNKAPKNSMYTLKYEINT